MSSMTDLSVSRLQGGCASLGHTSSFPKDAGSLPTVFGMQLEVDVSDDLFVHLWWIHVNVWQNQYSIVK